MISAPSVCSKCAAPLEREEGGARRCPFCGVRYELPAQASREDVSRDDVIDASAAAKSFGFGMSVFIAAFGVLWTCAALSMGAPIAFALFGLVFSGFAIFIGLTARKAARIGGVGRRSRRAFDGDDRGERRR